MSQLSPDDLVLTLRANMTELETAMSRVEGKLTDVERTTQTTTNNMTKLFQNAASVIQAVIASKIVMSIKNILDEESKMITQFNALKATGNFDKIADQFNRLEEATGGLVNKMDLIPSINRAFAFGIDLSGDRLLKFTALAQKTAALMGTDLTNAFNDLITGVGRQSKMILDNLGVLVDLDVAYNKFAKTLGKTSEELTDTEKKTALLNETITALEQNTKEIDISSITSNWEKMTKRLESGWKDVKGAFAGYVNEVMDWSEKLGAYIWDMLHPFEVFYAEAMQKAREESEIQKRYNTSLNAMSAERRKMIEESSFLQEKWRKEIEKQYEIEKKMAFFDFFQKMIDDAKILNQVVSLEDFSKKTLLAIEGFQKGLGVVTASSEKEIVKANEKANKDKEREQKELERRLQKKRDLAKTVAELELGDLKMKDFETEEQYRNHLTEIERNTGEWMAHSTKDLLHWKTSYEFAIMDAARKNEEILKNAKLAMEDLFKISSESMVGMEAKSPMESMMLAQSEASVAFIRQEEERAAMLEQTWENAYTGVANVAQNTMFQMWDALVKGEELKAEQVIGSLLYQAGAGLVSDGIANLWKAAAMAFYNPAAAGPLASIAAGEIAVGTAMGYGGQKMMPTQNSGSAGATERNITNEQQPTVINVKVSAFGDSVAEAVSGMTPVLKAARRQKVI